VNCRFLNRAAGNKSGFEVVELSRTPQSKTDQLWLELFDHDHQRTIDSYGGRTLVHTSQPQQSRCVRTQNT
jgi:hypothetical protein